MITGLEYYRLLEQKFLNQGVTIERYFLGQHNCAQVTGLRPSAALFNATLVAYLIHSQNRKEIGKQDLQSIIEPAMANTRRIHQYGPIKLGIGVSVPIVITEFGFEDETVNYVKNKKIYNMWRGQELCLPVLIDIRNQKFIVLKKYGFTASLPIRQQAVLLEKDYNFFFKP